MTRAAWLGTRIILEQVSPEAPSIFDLILELYRSCAGDWAQLSKSVEVPQTETNAFLEYAATFLSNIGNYYVITPRLCPKAVFQGLTDMVSGPW